MPYELLDHTGDIGIRVTAPDLPGLFAEAAAAFLELLTEPESVRADATELADVAGEDLADTMNLWLSWLLLRFALDGRLVCAVRGARLEGTRFRAEAVGERFDPERHPLKVELKAVTYHQLHVREAAGGGWEAQVIFDV
ncbi:MAG: archease [Planctomycetes bacterium]|nr:archease [Planctomycetota bacterium]